MVRRRRVVVVAGIVVVVVAAGLSLVTAGGQAHADTGTIRPNGTLTPDTCPKIGSASTKDVSVSDGSDATGIGSPNTGDVCQEVFDVGTVGSGTINSVTLHARSKIASATTGGEYGDIFVAARLGTTNGAVGQVECYPASPSFVSCDGPPAMTKPGGGAWTQADIDALRVYVYTADAVNTQCDQDGNCWNASVEQTITSEISVDVSYTPSGGTTTTTAPTTTTTTIAPTTTTTTPFVPLVRCNLWIESDPVHNPQHRWGPTTYPGPLTVLERMSCNYTAPTSARISAVGLQNYYLQALSPGGTYSAEVFGGCLVRVSTADGPIPSRVKILQDDAAGGRIAFTVAMPAGQTVNDVCLPRGTSPPQVDRTIQFTEHAGADATATVVWGGDTRSYPGYQSPPQHLSNAGDGQPPYPLGGTPPPNNPPGVTTTTAPSTTVPGTTSTTRCVGYTCSPTTTGNGVGGTGGGGSQNPDAPPPSSNPIGSPSTTVANPIHGGPGASSGATDCWPDWGGIWDPFAWVPRFAECLIVPQQSDFSVLGDLWGSLESKFPFVVFKVVSFPGDMFSAMEDQVKSDAGYNPYGSAGPGVSTHTVCATFTPPTGSAINLSCSGRPDPGGAAVGDGGGVLGNLAAHSEPIRDIRIVLVWLLYLGFAVGVARLLTAVLAR